MLGQAHLFLSLHFFKTTTETAGTKLLVLQVFVFVDTKKYVMPEVS